MTNTIAFVVAIERYDQPGWNVPGPAANALEVVKQLIRLGVHPDNIFLFLNENDASLGAISPIQSELAGLGVARNDPDQSKINACFNHLTKGRARDSRLFFYWCGHGYAQQNDDERILICKDYTTAGFEAQ